MDARARRQIEEVLFRDPEQVWTCRALASLLRLTRRTIAREVNVLYEMNKVELDVGWRRRISIKAKPPTEFPRWMDPVRSEDLQGIMVVSVRRHLMQDE